MAGTFKGYTFQQAKEILREHGVTISSRDGEYRVNLMGGDEAMAYYTYDLMYAIDTGIAMGTKKED